MLLLYEQMCFFFTRIDLEPSYRMVSLDVTSMFIRTPVDDIFPWLKQHCPISMCELFQHVLSYFLFEGKYYNQIEGTAVLQAVADLFMKHLEHLALSKIQYKTDDTFLIWLHGMKKPNSELYLFKTTVRKEK